MKKKTLRKITTIIYDCIGSVAAYYLALLSRYYVSRHFIMGTEMFVNPLIKMIPYQCLIVVLVFFLFKIYQTVWEYAGIFDVMRLFFASIISSILYTIFSCLFIEVMPNGYYGLGMVYSLILVCGSRVMYKVYLEERNQQISKKQKNIVSMIIGIGPVGRFIARQVESHDNLRIVCCIDTNDEGGTKYINGLPIYSGFSKIEKIVDKKKIKHIILADKNISNEKLNLINNICINKNITLENYVEYFENSVGTDSQIPLNTNNDGSRIIPFSPPDISQLEINEVKKALISGWITTGPRTKELENRIAKYCHTSKVVCLNSATAAEELNLRICGIGEGDEVIVPAYTYTATASAVIHCGAKVVFVDSQKDNCEMDYDQVEKAITNRTKAIVGVDLGGIVADYDRLYEIVENKKGLFKAKQGNDLGSRIQQAYDRVLVFADCAHALGAIRNGKMAGEIADFTDFSFHAVKNFTTAEGGASTWRDIPGIDNEEIYHQYQLYSLHGQSKDALAKTKIGAWEYDIIGPWYKCNMTDIMAAIGLRQLDRYPEMLQRRKQIIAKYDKMCDELKIKHLIHYSSDNQSSGHLYLTRIPDINDNQRREIIVKLAELGVSTNVHYKPLPMMSAYRELGWDIKDFPNAYKYYENLITLPLHTKLSDDDVNYIIINYKKVVKDYI